MKIYVSSSTSPIGHCMAAAKSNSFWLGPSSDMSITFSKVLVLRLQRKCVMIPFMALNAHSQSVVETGKATAREYSLHTRENNSCRESRERSSLATFCKDFASFISAEWFLASSTNSPTPL